MIRTFGRSLSIARSVQVALLGLTVLLAVIAGLGVARLYQGRQDYEDDLSGALRLQGAAGRLLAAGVVEEATLRLAPGNRSDAVRAHAAYATALADARALAAGDATSTALVARAARAQTALRAAARRTSGPARLGPRPALAALSARQDARIGDARHRATRRSRRALAAILAGAILALAAALVLVAALLAGVRRPLDALVGAAERLAGGDPAARVPVDRGPEELRAVARAFNAMAGDVETASSRVEAERRRLAQAIRSLGDGLVLTDARGAVVDANPRAHVLLAVPQPGSGFPPPVPLAAALRGEVELAAGDRTLAVTAAPLAGDAGGHAWTLRDTTERARLERMKSDFVATASHELRSPLTSIKGFVELLGASAGLSERQAEWTQIIRVSTDRLVELVGDLLDVTRLEAGQVELQRRPTDLAALVDEVTALLRPRLVERHQTLDVEVADLPRVLVDPGRIRQVLTNLLTNAHLYTGAGGRLGVTALAQGHALVLSVSDTGRGMDPEQVAQAFDRFFRAPGEHPEGQPPGTGLGLAIVRSLVELHRGSIEVRSEPGRGTTFAIRLPRAIEAAGDGEGPLAREALQGRRVLVVDDEPDTARLIAAHLAAFDVRAEVVHSGPDAMRALRRERFDALTLDVLMPGMTGFEVLRELRADPALARLPVVVVSVFSGREALRGEWVVPKPIDAGELADALGAAFVSGRVRVLAVGRPGVRAGLDHVLDELGIAREWAGDAGEAAERCAVRRYEAALVDAGVADAPGVMAALDLRGRRLRRAVVVFRSEDEAPGFALLDADPVAVRDAGSAVLGLLGAVAPSSGE